MRFKCSWWWWCIPQTIKEYESNLIFSENQICPLLLPATIWSKPIIVNAQWRETRNLGSIIMKFELLYHKIYECFQEIQILSYREIWIPSYIFFENLIFTSHLHLVENYSCKHSKCCHFIREVCQFDIKRNEILFFQEIWTLPFQEIQILISKYEFHHLIFLENQICAGRRHLM